MHSSSPHYKATIRWVIILTSQHNRTEQNRTIFADNMVKLKEFETIMGPEKYECVDTHTHTYTNINFIRPMIIPKYLNSKAKHNFLKRVRRVWTQIFVYCMKFSCLSFFLPPSIVGSMVGGGFKVQIANET